MAKNVVTLRQGPYGVKDDDDMFDSDVSISKCTCTGSVEIASNRDGRPAPQGRGGHIGPTLTPEAI